MPNRYRPPLVLAWFTSDRAPVCVRPWLATELVATLPSGRVKFKYSLIGVSAN